MTIRYKIITLLLISSATYLFSDANGPFGDYTGAPLANGNAGATCGVTNCHTGSADNGVSIHTWVSLKDSVKTVSSFELNKIYTVHVEVSGNSKAKTFGFQSTVLNTSRGKVGTTTAGSGNKVITTSNRNIVEHSSPSANGIFTYNWTSPATTTDTIKIYSIGNATDGQNTSSNDQFMKSTVVLPLKATVAAKNLGMLQTIPFFPNPFTDNIQLTGTAMQAQLYSINGELVLQQNQTDHLNTGLLKPGLYFLVLSNGSLQTTFSVVKY